MSDEELMRRDKAGTLRSETILANAKRSLARETDEPATVGSSQQVSLLPSWFLFLVLVVVLLCYWLA